MPRQRIGGDLHDLPAGWIVDEDNWGTRPIRSGDRERFESSPPSVYLRACFESGSVCVLVATAAAYMDGDDTELGTR